MLIMGVCYTYSLFQPYVMEHFNVDSPSASLPFTIFIAVFCIGNFVGGRMQQKTNIKFTLIVGYVMMVLGWLGTAVLYFLMSLPNCSATSVLPLSKFSRVMPALHRISLLLKH